MTATKHGYRSSVEALRSAGKSNYGAPAYSRFVNRPVGRRFAAVAHVLNMTPNQVTALSATFSAVAIAMIVALPPSILMGLLVALALAIGYALDSADGQLARLRGGGRPVGEWLDHTVDMAKTVMLHSAVLISWLRFAEGPTGWAWALVPLGFATVSVVAFFAWLLVDLLQRVAGTGPERKVGDKAPVLRSLARLPSDYGLLAWTFVIFGVAAIFVPVYSVLLVLNLLILLAALPVWYRQAAAIPPSGK